MTSDTSRVRPPVRADDSDTTTCSMRVNGIEHEIDIESRETLVDTLRERLGLTGAKKGCDRGECGACTVLLNGRRVLSCMTLTISAAGCEVTTIEGLAADGELHPVQRAFLDNDAFQCGFCTPGQVMSAVACIAEGHASTADEIREWMSGNICRCAAYPQIVHAVAEAAQRSASGTSVDAERSASGTSVDAAELADTAR